MVNQFKEARTTLTRLLEDATHLAQTLDEIEYGQNPEAFQEPMDEHYRDTPAPQADTPATEVPKVEPEPVAEQPTLEPEPEEPAVTMDDVRKKLTELTLAGFREDVQRIIREHGAAKISELDPSTYASVIAAADAVDTDLLAA